MKPPLETIGIICNAIGDSSRIFLSIIGTLEKLKQEAADITKKVEETDAVMAEVEAVTDQYRPLSQSCSSIYFTMESLNLVSQPSIRCQAK